MGDRPHVGSPLISTLPLVVKATFSVKKVPEVHCVIPVILIILIDMPFRNVYTAMELRYSHT